MNKFWFVCDERRVRGRHDSLEDAVAYAKRLQAASPGAAYVVLEAVQRTVKSTDGVEMEDLS